MISVKVPKTPVKKARGSGANPLPDTITPVPGYPKKLIICKVACSRFWWARVYVNGRYRVRSLKTEVKNEALRLAKQFYEEVLVDHHKGSSKELKSRVFAAVGNAFIETQNLPGKERRYNDDRIRYKKELLPYFAEKDVGEISNADIVGLTCPL